jgi:hypothetical protein
MTTPEKLELLKGLLAEGKFGIDELSVRSGLSVFQIELRLDGYMQGNDHFFSLLFEAVSFIIERKAKLAYQHPNSTDDSDDSDLFRSGMPCNLPVLMLRVS